MIKHIFILAFILFGIKYSNATITQVNKTNQHDNIYSQNILKLKFRGLLNNQEKKNIYDITLSKGDLLVLQQAVNLDKININLIKCDNSSIDMTKDNNVVINNDGVYKFEISLKSNTDININYFVTLKLEKNK